MAKSWAVARSQSISPVPVKNVLRVAVVDLAANSVAVVVAVVAVVVTAINPDTP